MHFLKSGVILALPLFLSSLVYGAPSVDVEEAAAAAAVPKGFCESKAVPGWVQEKIFMEFINTLYKERNAPLAFHKYAQLEYAQHVVSIGQGPQNSIKYYAPFLSQQNVTFLHLGFDNGIGYAHAVNYLPSMPTPFLSVDIYAMNGSCVSAHWGVGESVAANDTNPLTTD